MELNPDIPYHTLSVSHESVSIRISPTPRDDRSTEAVERLVRIVGGDELPCERLRLNGVLRYGQIIRRAGQPTVDIFALSDADTLTNRSNLDPRALRQSTRIAKFVGSAAIPIRRAGLQFLDGGTQVTGMITASCIADDECARLEHLITAYADTSPRSGNQHTLYIDRNLPVEIINVAER